MSFEFRRDHPELSELLSLVREDGLQGEFAVPQSADSVGRHVIVNGADADAWRVERLEALDLEGDDPKGVVAKEEDPTWDILPLSSFWLADAVVERMVEARDTRIQQSMGDQVNPN